MDAMEKLNELLDNITEDMSETKETLIESGKEANISINSESKKQYKSEPIDFEITEQDREQAVYECLIPKAYTDVKFSADKIKENIKNQYARNKLYKVFKFNSYISVCNEVISAIRMKILPQRSYLIGAPNGFGKTSFVNECIITLRKNGFKTVPYISLWELAQLRIDNEQRIMKPYKKFKEEGGKVEYLEPNKVVGFSKSPEIVIGKYSYSEYINADCLFVHFTDVISKEIESHTLFQLLNIRGTKGLPTIVMISTSLEPYENDKRLRELVWDEIKTYNENSHCYDRVFHVSCYKQKVMNLDNKDEKIENDTGIVM